jgi:antirestriction protein
MEVKTNYKPRVFIGTPLDGTCGQWVDLPASYEELEQIRWKIAGGGDHIISDMEDLPGVGQYHSLGAVSDYASWLVTENPEPDLVEAFAAAGTDIEDMPRKYKEGDYTIVEGETEADLAENYLDELGGVENVLSPDKIAAYFDYEKFGRDLTIDGFSQYGGHWVQIL